MFTNKKYLTLVFLLSFGYSTAGFHFIPSFRSSSPNISPTTMLAASKHTLYDMPVSNNGARCRLILYKKQIDALEVEIVPPSTLEGGLKGPAYSKLNPQQKMPLLIIHPEQQGSSSSRIRAVPESDTICRYLLSRYSEKSPSFLPNSVTSNLLCRIHDVYISPIQGCLYKASPPFGSFGTRSEALEELKKQLIILEDTVQEEVVDDSTGPYLLGSEVSLADATLFPTMIFIHYMLPKFGVPPDQVLPKSINDWFHRVREQDVDFAKVFLEISDALLKWETSNRWSTIRLAGLRDEEPGTIFDKIIDGSIPAAIVKQDASILAFKDINPAAPAHVLVIPKIRNGLTSLRKSSPEHIEILGKMLVTAGEIAKDRSLGFGDGARIVINDGEDGGQTVNHLHMHVLGGRYMSWPPG